MNTFYRVLKMIFVTSLASMIVWGMVIAIQIIKGW